MNASNFFIGVSYLARYFQPGQVVRVGDRQKGDCYELVSVYGPNTNYYGQWSARETFTHRWTRIGPNEPVTLVAFSLGEYENEHK